MAIAPELTQGASADFQFQLAGTTAPSVPWTLDPEQTVLIAGAPGSTAEGSFLATDTLAASVWQGSNETAILSPTTAWISATTAQVKVILQNADSASLAIGLYYLNGGYGCGALGDHGKRFAAPSMSKVPGRSMFPMPGLIVRILGFLHHRPGVEARRRLVPASGPASPRSADRCEGQGRSVQRSAVHREANQRSFDRLTASAAAGCLFDPDPSSQPLGMQGILQSSLDVVLPASGAMRRVDRDDHLPRWEDSPFDLLMTSARLGIESHIGPEEDVRC